MNIKTSDGKITLEELEPNDFSNVKSAEKISNALSIVNKNLEKTQRNLTYFDVYKFYSAITSESEFVSKINELPPNMATIINTTYFTYDNQAYKQGDVVVRNNNGDLIHIESISGGYYYPSFLGKNDNDGDKTYTLHYSYSVTPPTEGETKIGAGKASKTIKIEGLEEEKDANIYGFVFKPESITEEHKWTPFSFDAAHSANGELIRPMIKMYSEKGEEVYVDFKITLTNADTYTVSGVPEIVTYAVIK